MALSLLLAGGVCSAGWDGLHCGRFGVILLFVHRVVLFGVNHLHVIHVSVFVAFINILISTLCAFCFYQHTDSLSVISGNYWHLCSILNHLKVFIKELPVCIHPILNNATSIYNDNVTSIIH